MAQQCFNLFLLLRAKMLLSTAILAAHNKRGAVLGHVKSWAARRQSAGQARGRAAAGPRRAYCEQLEWQ
jgi:hypothetical protein